MRRLFERLVARGEPIPHGLQLQRRGERRNLAQEGARRGAAVAAELAEFNIVAMLVMVVTDKRTDIAILRTFGTSPARVMGVFLTQGLVIGWLGVALGVALGLALAFNVDTIVPFLQNTFGFQIFSSSVYYITTVPSIVRWGNVAAISVAALLLTAAATLYPAVRAARTAPAEALRYE